jgi:hypothetical protein
MPLSQLRLRRTTISGLLAAGVLLTLVAQVLPHPLAPSAVLAAPGTPCVTWRPSSGTYSIRLCLTEPRDGATLHADVPVTASVTTVSGTSPGVDNISFYLTKQPSSGRSSSALTDFKAPFTFILPAARWVDGAYRLEALARMADGSVTTGPIISVTLAYGGRVIPSSGNTWGPKTSTVRPLVVAAVGDGAGGLPGAAHVADLIGTWNPTMVLYLGDVYNTGTYAEFTNYYAPTLGRFDAITNPTIGNHEWGNNLQGYFAYWDTTRHFYSYNAAGWHFVSLDSTTEFGQTMPGSAQYEWLAQDLAANPADCTLVFMHHPRYGLGLTNGNAYLRAIWSLLAQTGVDLVLTGHEHNYQRWQPLNGAGARDLLGPTQFVIGTGGHELLGTAKSDSRVVTQVRNTDGALRLDLDATSARFAFSDTSGTVLDAGVVPCHGVGEGSAAPTPSGTFSFSDDFELGTLSRWTSGTGLVPQRDVVDTGSWAIRGTTRGTTASYAYKDLSPGQGDLYYRTRFNLLTQDPATTLTVLRLRGGRTQGSLLVVFVANTGKLCYGNTVAATTTCTTAVVTRDTWHELQVHVRINDGLVELWYDGARLSSKPEALGTEPITRLQLGETVTAPTNPFAKTYDIAFDNVTASTSYIGSQRSAHIEQGEASAPASIWDAPWHWRAKDTHPG